MKSASLSLNDMVWPCELPVSVREKLFAIAVPIGSLSELPRKVDSEVRGVLYVAEGVCCVTFHSESSNTMNGAVFGANTWLGAAMMYSRVILKAEVEDVLKTTCLYFPKDKIEQLAEEEPLVYKWLYRSTNHAHDSWLRAQIASLYDKEVRIIATLLEIAKHVPVVKGSHITLRLSQRILSSVCGISRPRLNEVLKTLESKSLITVQRGAITLLDVKSLQAKLAPMEHLIIPR